MREWEGMGTDKGCKCSTDTEEQSLKKTRIENFDELCAILMSDEDTNPVRNELADVCELESGQEQ